MPARKPDPQLLAKLAKRVRHHILTATTAAGSGHPSSSLSATDLLTCLFFGGFLRYDLNRPELATNDRFILSKGHAAPLFYSLLAVGGAISTSELHTLRQFTSRLEGHPTMQLPWVEAATGSLGQGLSIGVGMALAGRYLDHLEYNTYVLVGDSELAEGSNWEAIQLASHYKLSNLIGILDVNRLGQRGETMLGNHLSTYTRRLQAFGWRTIEVDGHDMKSIVAGFNKAISQKYTPAKPVMIIAKTIKGKGVRLMEDQPNWHGKTLNQDQLDIALQELGPTDLELIGTLAKPPETSETIASSLTSSQNHSQQSASQPIHALSTREAYGKGLLELAATHPELVVLDAEVSNSTFAATFKDAYPDRFFEMFIAEQNMVSVALGLQKRGKHPFVSSFAAFLTRAFDQIRSAQYSLPTISFAGSHAGISIGEDGATQMGLEDIAMFRSIQNSIILYPADTYATIALTAELANRPGIGYLRTTRATTPLVYTANHAFKIGGSHTFHHSAHESYTLIGAGITLHEALLAQQLLAQEKISVRVIDLYSIKPIDDKTLAKAAVETKGIFVIEDHVAEGGMAEAVRSSLFAHTTPIYSLAVRKLPRSGSQTELLAYAEIDAEAIVKSVKGVHLP